MKINKIIGLACALGVLGSFGNAECINSGEEDNRKASAANIERLSPEIKELIAKADNGDAEAQYELGFCYKLGIGVAKDPIKALHWYKKAADQGHKDAKHDCNRLQEIEALIAKAEAGDPDAQCKLGLCYEYGKGVAKDTEKALKLYQQAADQGHTEAQYKLGWHYYDIERFDDAVKWHQKAADQGHPQAQFDLGRYYEYGIGVAKNPEKALRWFKEAAEKGHKVAQYTLGKHYYDIERFDDAFEWYQKAADQGHAQAKRNLARLTAKK